ncbi:MAG: hypothetical protein H0V51_14460 [Chloroflexi bacterium]|nr:hypothetical protein [Chloroflexota bacterium]
MIATLSRVAEGASTSPKMRARSRWSVPVWTRAQPILKAYARKHRTAPLK